MPFDFFLWGYLKEKVFKHRPRSLEDLKERMKQEIDSIPPELTRRVMKNFRERLQQCVTKDGRHMSDIIFKTHLKKLFYVLFRNIFHFFFLDSFFHFFISLQIVWDLYAPPCMSTLGRATDCVASNKCQLHTDVTNLSLWAGHALIPRVLCFSWCLLPPDHYGYSRVREDQY